MVHRFPATHPLPAATARDRAPAIDGPPWLAGLGTTLVALGRRLRALLPGGRAAAVPIAVLCDAADPAARRRLRRSLRAGLREAERALAGWPDLAITVAVLETVGTPGRTDDLGALVAACRVQRRPDGWRAVIRLAATAAGQPLTDDNRLTALWLALDWLLDWRPDGPDAFTVPYQPAAAAPPIDLPAVPPLPPPRRRRTARPRRPAPGRTGPRRHAGADGRPPSRRPRRATPRPRPPCRPMASPGRSRTMRRRRRDERRCSTSPASPPSSAGPSAPRPAARS